jgi:hypothetical protein
MGCNTCRNSCGDCSEGGITFKRAPRSPAPGTQPVARRVREQPKPLLFAEHQTKVLQGQKAQT